MKSLLVLLLLVSINPLSQAKEIAITFDDSPRMAKGYFSGPERAKKLIAELKKHKVPKVVFFSNSGKLDAEGIRRLEAYSQAGHIIANHTHDHLDFNTTNLKDYIHNVSLADEKLKQFKTFKKLFRYPYLREGDSLEKRDGMRKWLEEHDYINAYITLNNYDWYLESLFQSAFKKDTQLDLKRMRNFYVSVMVESIEYYDEMAQTHLGRSPKHILLLHEMDISALFIGDLVSELRSKGWKIISTEEAYTDKIAEYQSQRTFRYNPGKIGEIAHSKGQKKGLWHKSLDEKYLKTRFNQEVLNSNKIHLKGSGE